MAPMTRPHDFAPYYRKHKHHFLIHTNTQSPQEPVSLNSPQSGPQSPITSQDTLDTPDTSLHMMSYNPPLVGSAQPATVFPRPGPFERMWKRMRAYAIAGTAFATLTACAIGYVNHLVDQELSGEIKGLIWNARYELRECQASIKEGQGVTQSEGRFVEENSKREDAISNTTEYHHAKGPLLEDIVQAHKR